MIDLGAQVNNTQYLMETVDSSAVAVRVVAAVRWLEERCGREGEDESVRA